MEPLVQGNIQKVGNINIFVLEGYTPRSGNNMGEEDDNQIWLQTDPPTFTDYYWVIVGKEESDVDLSIAMTKDMNGGTDVEQFALGESTWSGLTYLYGELVCNVLKGKFSGGYCQVTIIGHDIESPEVQTVLSSIELA